MKYLVLALGLVSLLAGTYANAFRKDPETRSFCGQAVDYRRDDMWPAGADVKFTPDEPVDGHAEFGLHALNNPTQEFLDNIKAHKDRTYFVCVTTTETVQSGIDSVFLRINEIH